MDPGMACSDCSFVRRYTNSDTYSYTNPNSNADTYSNAYSNTKLPSLCCWHKLCVWPGSDKCRWLLHV